MSELEAILNDEPEQPQEPEPVESNAEPVEEIEQEASTGDTEASTESASDADEEGSTPEPKKPDDAPNWQFEAYKDEKRKRQDLESKYSDLEKKLESIQNPKKEEEIPDVFEDQNTYTSYIKNQIDQTALSVRAEMSQFMAEREYGKDVVEQKLEAFREMAKTDQSLTNKVLASTSPVHEAIEIVNKAEKLKQLENIEDYESKVRAEIEEKVRKELEAKFSESQSKRSSVTPSLNTKASASQTEAVDTLADILGGR